MSFDSQYAFNHFYEILQAAPVAVLVTVVSAFLGLFGWNAFLCRSSATDPGAEYDRWPACVSDPFYSDSCATVCGLLWNAPYRGLRSSKSEVRQ